MADSAPQNPEGDLKSQEYRDEVIFELSELLLRSGALQFGRFPGPLGKTSPYLLDSSLLSRGVDQFCLGRAYALTINRVFGGEVGVLIGTPKGLPFAVIASQYYGHMCNHNAAWGYCLQGTVVNPVITAGAQLDEYSNVVIVDDILANGTDLRETISHVKKSGAKVLGAVTLIDRKEKSKGQRLAASDIERDTGVKVASCATITEIMKKIEPGKIPEDKRDALVRASTLAG